MNAQALVSVIIPVYNCEKYLASAIESILKQNYRPIEIIVVDDGSNDNTAQVSSGFGDKIKYIYQENVGVSKARNTGLKAARGEIITFLDSDDLWIPNKLQIQLDYLERNPNSLVVIGKTQFFKFDKINKQEKIQIIADSQLFLNLGSAVFKKAAFTQIGLFDETLQYSEDVDWFNRARENNIPIVMHPEVVLLYQQHQNNMTRNKVASELKILKVLKQSLDRRRDKNKGTIESLPKFSEVEKS
jgi:glycosyltransferase involved in cell wall biosynthesis